MGYWWLSCCTVGPAAIWKCVFLGHPVFYISPNICLQLLAFGWKCLFGEEKGETRNFYFEIISHNIIYIIFIFQQLYHKRNKEREGKTSLRKRKYLCKSLSTFSVWRFRDHFVKVWASPAAKDGHKTLQNSCTEAKIWIFSRLLKSSKNYSPEESIFWGS